MRVFLIPKRFPAVYEVPDWRDRIIAVGEEYVVVDKPAGVQVGGVPHAILCASSWAAPANFVLLGTCGFQCPHAPGLYLVVAVSLCSPLVIVS